MSDATSVGKIALDLGLNTSKFKKEMNGIGSTANNLATGAFKKIALAASAAFSVAALVSFGKSAIELGSNLSEVQNVVDVTFGSMASKINEFAKTAMFSFGLSETSAKKMTGTMGAMLKSMGIVPDKAADMSIELAKLSGDFASFYNMDAEEAFTKIRSGISGETEGLKALGINLSIANLEAYALTKGITKSYNKMTQMEQAQLRYNYLLKVSADAQGDFARTSDSWANQTRVLTLQWDSFKASIGQGLITLFTPILVGINKVVAGLVKLGATFSAFTTHLFGAKKESENIGKSLANVANNSGEVADSQDNLAASTKKANKEVKKSILGFDQLNVMQKDAVEASEELADAGGFSAADAEVTDPGAAANEQFKAFDEFVRKAKNIFNRELKPVLGQFADLWNNSVLPRMQQSWSLLFPKLSGIAQKGFGLLKTIAVDFWEGFKNNLPDALEQWGRWFDNVSDLFDLGMSTFLDIVSSGLDVVVLWWGDWGTKLIDGTWKTVIGIWDTINLFFEQWIKPLFEIAMKTIKDVWDNSFKGMFESLLDFVATAIDGANEIWQKFIKPIVDWLIVILAPVVKRQFQMIADIIGSVFKTIGGVFDGFFTMLKGVIDFIVGIFTGDWQRAWEGMTSIAEGQVKMFKAIWEGIVGIIKAPINFLIDALNESIDEMNGIKVDIPDWVPVFGGKTFGLSIPHVPRLANGGIVSSPTLAMVGDNKRSDEVVSPLHELLPMITNAVNSASGMNDMLLREILAILKMILDSESDISVFLDGVYDSNIRAMKRKNMRAGKTIVPVY